MKKEINNAIKTKKEINEVLLFRSMADAFNNNKYSKCIYVEEIHGGKSIIGFPSKYRRGNEVKVELGDLLLLTFDKARQELRICILQAKYKSEVYRKYLNFRANLFQWELLLEKPILTDVRHTGFPKNILCFQNGYFSITAYGIFYHDRNGEIEFLYTVPHNIRPRHCPYNMQQCIQPYSRFNIWQYSCSECKRCLH